MYNNSSDLHIHCFHAALKKYIVAFSIAKYNKIEISLQWTMFIPKVW